MTKRFQLMTLIGLFFLQTQVLAQVPKEPTDIAPLLISEKVPDLNMTNLEGQPVSFLSKVSEKPTVLIFYRGGWCPFCNMQLLGLQKIESDILTLGFQILAISPDAPGQLKKTSDKQELNYQLYSDSDTQLMQAFGLAYEVNEQKKKQLSEYSNHKNPGYLPVPTVFVLNQDGIIQFEYISPNYRVRMDEEMLLAVLKTMQD